MTESDVALPSLRSRIEALAPTWEIRLVLAFRVNPFVVGAGITAVLAALSFLYNWVLDQPVRGVEADTLFTEQFSRALFVCVLIGYAFSAFAYGTQAVCELLHPSISLAEQFDQGQASRPLSRRAGAVGVFLTWSLLEALIVLNGANPVGSWYYPHPELLTFYFMLLLGWLGGRVVYYTFLGIRGGEGDVTVLPETDLLDLRAAHAPGQLGLRLSLMWLIGVAVMTPIMVDPDNLMSLTSPIVIIALGLAVATLLLPASGTHKRVRAEKRAELERIDAAIRGSETAARQLRLPDRFCDASFADLVAYRGLIESIREWPFDTTTLRRFLLYLLIPVGSWVAAAIVERGIDRWLG